MNILILEDDPTKTRMPKFKRNLIGHIVYHAKTPREAISFLRSNQIDVLFLDHDLSGTGEPEPSGPGTGYEVAVWLERHPEFKPQQIILHSLNPTGRARMKQALPEAQEAPGAWDLIR
jgi:CheY-like chemotaxis protein